MYGVLTHKQLFLRFFRNVFSYGMGNLCVRASSLLLLPLYWKRLEPTDYGIIGVAQIAIPFLAPIFGLGLSHAVQRFYLDWRESERPHFLAGFWVLSLAFGVTVVLTLEVIGRFGTGEFIRSIPFSPCLEFTLWNAFFSSHSLIPLTLLRIREQSLAYNRITFFSVLTQEIFVLIAIFGIGLRAEGYLGALLVNSVLWSLVYLRFTWKEILFPVPWAKMKPLVRYAWPFVPTGVLDGGMSAVDRFSIEKVAPLAQIGLYSVANQLGSIVNVFHGVIKTAWHPFIFRVLSERKDAPVVLARFSFYYMLALSFPLLIVAVLSIDFIRLSGSPRYLNAYPLVPFFALAYWVQGLGESFGRGLDISKRTIFGPLPSFFAILTVITLIIALVPRFGIVGGAIAYLSGFSVRAFIQTGLATYLYPRPTPWFRLVFLFTSLVLSFHLISGVQPENPYEALLVRALLVGTALCLITAVSMYKEGYELIRKNRFYNFGR